MSQTQLNCKIDGRYSPQIVGSSMRTTLVSMTKSPERNAERGVCEREMEGVGIELLHPETFVLTRHLLPRVIKAGKI